MEILNSTAIRVLVVGNRGIGNIYTYSYFIDIFYRYLLTRGYHSRREVRTMAPPAGRVQSETGIFNGIQNEVMALCFLFFFFKALLFYFITLVKFNSFRSSHTGATL